jgi:sugar lactone lactonase YvrE
MCLDADGQIWFANPARRHCVRVREGGEVTGQVTCSQTAYACVLGGDDRQTLFVMTGTTSDRFEIADKTLGRIEAVHVEVAGAGTP